MTAAPYLVLRRRRISGSGGAFDPASLFASGESGVWYEPSTTTAFRSTTDLTPCAVGESCGFLLDKSQGAGYSGGAFTGLGSELITNGTFDTDTSGWSVVSGTATLAVVGGQLAVQADALDNPIAEQSISTEIGKTYRVTFDADKNDASQMRVAVATQTGQVSNVLGPFFISGQQSIDAVFVATATTMYFSVRNIADNIGDTVFIDNISVRELPGFHATQGTAAARPILRQTGGGIDYLEDDEVDDALNWTAPTDTDYTVAYVNSSGTVTILTGQSLSGATDILLDPALAAYIAVDRALTAGETSGLTSYLEALA